MRIRNPQSRRDETELIIDQLVAIPVYPGSCYPIMKSTLMGSHCLTVYIDAYERAPMVINYDQDVAARDLMFDRLIKAFNGEGEEEEQ